MRQLLASSIQHRWIPMLLAMFILAGCSADYTGERMFWKAQQLEQPLLKDVSKASPEQIESVMRAFEQIAQKVPGTIWAARSHAIIGSLHTIQKHYDQARTSYRLILQNYNQYHDLCLGARLAIAKTYEMEKKWDDAVKAYQDLADQHPWSGTGLEVPLYIAALHERHDQKALAKEDYARAVRTYTKLIPDAPTPELMGQVKGYLAVAYQRLGEWDHAVEVLKEISTVQGINRPLILLTLGAIYQTKVSNPQKAEEAYRQLIQEFPEHPFVKAAKAQLERLGAGHNETAPLPSAPTDLPPAPESPSTP